MTRHDTKAVLREATINKTNSQPTSNNQQLLFPNHSEPTNQPPPIIYLMIPYDFPLL